MDISDIKIEEYSELAKILADLVYEFQGLNKHFTGLEGLGENAIKVSLNCNTHFLKYFEIDANQGILFDEIRLMSVKEIRMLFYEIREKLEVVRLRALENELKGQL